MGFLKKTADKGPASPEERASKRRRRWKVFRIRLVIFLIFWFLIEVTMRMLGYKPGVIVDAYYQEGEAIYDPILLADSNGVTRHSRTGVFYAGQFINEQGYFSKVNFTRQAMDSLRREGKKVVMLVGDSYAAGCCIPDFDQTFANRINASDEYEVLNLGVGGVDPLHYELVIKKFLPVLKPDLVLVTVFLGNDEMSYDRTPKPYIPVCYAIKNGFWFSSEANIGLAQPNEYFRNFDEASDFYFNYYSLRSSRVAWYEKVIRNSILASRFYLLSKQLLRKWELGDQRYSPPEKPLFTYQHLNNINTYCGEHDTPVIFTGIPCPTDISGEIDVRTEYAHLFGDLPWSSPKGLSSDDYLGPQVGDHFNTSGHHKFADFLLPLIENQLKVEQ